MTARKTLRVTEIRALTNRYLAGSDPELAEFRAGVAAMYEHLAMMAGDYRGYNDLVQVWSGEPGAVGSIYVPDETYRRAYHGEMTGPDAGPEQTAINTYRASTRDRELVRRRTIAGAAASPQDTYDHIFGSGATSYSWWRGLKTDGVDLATFDVEPGWSVAVTCDDGDDGKRTVTVDHHGIMRAARRLISEPPQYAGDAVIRECKHLLWSADDTDFDAASADQLLQFIVLGEIVFG